MSSVEVALQQILQSNLPTKTAASAARLLLHVHPNNGFTCLSWQQLSDILGIAPGTAQRHLTQMHQARVIHYSTNGDGLVYVTFKAWVLPSRVESTKSSTGIDEIVEKIDDRPPEDNLTPSKKSTKSSTGIDEIVEKIDVSYTHERARSIHSFIHSSSSSDENERMNECPPQPTPDEQVRSVALLRDPEVGLDPGKARQFAASFGFDYLLRQVCAWRRDGRATGTGALISRIERQFGAVITEGDRASPLYRRHVPAEEDAANDEEERRRKYDLNYWSLE